jgi:hypothetical protein
MNKGNEMTRDCNKQRHADFSEGSTYNDDEHNDNKHKFDKAEDEEGTGQGVLVHDGPGNHLGVKEEEGKYNTRVRGGGEGILYGKGEERGSGGGGLARRRARQ